MRSVGLILCVCALLFVPAGAALAGRGSDPGPPIAADQMKGTRRLPDCTWKTGSIVTGICDGAIFVVEHAYDIDIYYDPYDVYDCICARWKVLDGTGNEAPPENARVEYAESDVDPEGKIHWYRVDVGFYAPGAYTVKCEIDDNCKWNEETQQYEPCFAGDPMIVRTMTVDAQFSLSILHMVSTDGMSRDYAEPVGGNVGVELEWVYPTDPLVKATHECDLLVTPQFVYSWCPHCLWKETPCDFPHRGVFWWDSADPGIFLPPHLHNGEWVVEPELICFSNRIKQERRFIVQNLTIDDAQPEYLIYDPDAGTGNTITYKLNDAYDVHPAAQETQVTLDIYQSDGMPVKSEMFTKTAHRGGAEYVYVWDGKDWNGELMPAGIYTYRISAEQFVWGAEGCDPPCPLRHSDSDCEKSNHYISDTFAEVVSCDPETGASTVRVSFVVDGEMDPPLPDNFELSRARLEVFDPDLDLVASTESVSSLRLNQWIEFQDVTVPLTKSGQYTFLISAWDKQYWNLPPVDKAHRQRPLLQQNYRHEVIEIMAFLDAGHGGSDPGTTGTNRYPDWHEREAVEWERQDLRTELINHVAREHPGWIPQVCAWKRYSVQLVPRYIGKLGRVQRAEWVDNRLVDRKPDYPVFLSLHCNGGGTSSRETEVYYRPDIANSQEMATALLQNLQNIDDNYTPPLQRTYESIDATDLERQTMLRALANEKKRQYSFMMPCNLLELVMLTTPEDEDMINTEFARDLFAEFTHITYCYFNFTAMEY